MADGQIEVIYELAFLSAVANQLLISSRFAFVFAARHKPPSPIFLDLYRRLFQSDYTCTGQSFLTVPSGRNAICISYA